MWAFAWPARGRVREPSGFFAENERWLNGVLEGAMLVARSAGDVDHFRAVARCLLTTVAR